MEITWFDRVCEIRCRNFNASNVEKLSRFSSLQKLNLSGKMPLGVKQMIAQLDLKPTFDLDFEAELKKPSPLQNFTWVR